MSEQEQLPDEVLSSTDLAFERTLIAEDRTLMAWIRTAISLISFGFTIYKFFQEAELKRDVHHFFNPRLVGMIMIGLGILGLLLAQIDHYYATRALKKQFPRRRRSVSGVMALLIWAFGLALFLAALFRQ